MQKDSFMISKNVLISYSEKPLSIFIWETRSSVLLIRMLIWLDHSGKCWKQTTWSKPLFVEFFFALTS